MEFLNYGPLNSEKLQFMGEVLGVCLWQTPTGIDDDGIGSVITSLVEDSPQARPTSVSVQFKGLSEISIGKTGCHGAQMLQVIKWLLPPVVPGDSHPLLACIFTGPQFKQGLGYLCELRNEPVIVPHEPQKTLDLSDGGGGRPFSNSIYFYPHWLLFHGQRHCVPGMLSACGIAHI